RGSPWILALLRPGPAAMATARARKDHDGAKSKARPRRIAPLHTISNPAPRHFVPSRGRLVHAPVAIICRRRPGPASARFARERRAGTQYSRGRRHERRALEYWIPALRSPGQKPGSLGRNDNRGCGNMIKQPGHMRVSRGRGAAGLNRCSDSRPARPYSKLERQPHDPIMTPDTTPSGSADANSHASTHAISEARIVPAFRAPYAPADEAVAGALIAATARPAAAEARIDGFARRLIEGIRNRTGGLGGIEDFLHAYSLSTKEGLALMVLAEALLRVPDAATADRLIEDKLATGDWSSHHVKSSALLVSASAWTLGVTA